MTDTNAIDREAYPFAPHYVDIGEGRLHYVDEGQGETLLFAHGTPTWSFEWRHLIKGLAPTWRCVAPDHLGFGLSDRPRDADYTPEAHAKRFARFVDALGLERFTLVVHDFGGPIGLPFCLEHPERVERIVIINSWMWSFADDPAMAKNARVAGGALGRFLYRWANFSLRVLTPYAYGDRRKLTPTIHRQYLDRFPDAWSRGAVLWALARSMLGSSAFYDSLWQRRALLLGRPALLVWGMADRAFPPYILDRWRTALPEAQVVELPGAGHWPHEEAPAQVLGSVSHFLAQSVLSH